MNFKHLIWVAALALTMTACDDDDVNRKDDNTAAGKILFSTTVTNPSGDSGSGYLQAVGQLDGGVSYSNANAIPLGFGSYPCVCKSGNIYVFPDYMGGTELKLRRYVLNADNQLELKGSMMLPANSSAAIVVEASQEKAYICCQSLDLIIVFNPETMTETGRIDVSSLHNEGVSAYPGALYIRDGILYVALEQYNSQWMPSENALEMALYNVADDQFIKKIRNTSLGLCGPTRPIDNHSIFEDEQGDLLDQTDAESLVGGEVAAREAQHLGEQGPADGKGFDAGSAVEPKTRHDMPDACGEQSCHTPDDP